jgi:hypothetical protein
MKGDNLFGQAATLINIGTPFLAALICIAGPNAKSAYAQSRAVGNVASASGPFGARPGLRGESNQGRREFGSQRVLGGFRRPFNGAGSQFFGLPGVVGPLAPSNDYDSLRCVLHRPVDTPRGRVYEPVYVC